MTNLFGPEKPVDLTAVFAAGRVRRWHTNPELSWTDDYLDGHQGRVARIVMALWPDASGRLVRAALTHDDGEAGIGDLAQPAKEFLDWANPECLSTLEFIERDNRIVIWGSDPELANHESRRLKLADRLDAYMWAKHKAPHILSRDDWREAAEWIRAEADRLGVLDQAQTALLVTR